MWQTVSRVGLAVSLVLALTGLRLFGLFGGSKSTEQACPAAVILRPLANTAVFAPGAAPRPENVAFYGFLDEVDSRCEALQGAVRVHLTVDVIAQRGPAAGGNNTADFTYFVAAVAPGETILQKQPLAVRVTIPPGKLRAGVADRFDEVIPLAGTTASAVTIDVGFQQSPEAINFYQHFRGR
ncbi:MAG: hypothetical protein ACREE4_19035 [Stellaceae bacterium]